MTDANGLDEDVTRELRAAGREQDEPLVVEAVQGVAASHAGRPVDEIEAVLREAIRTATGDPGLLSPESLNSTARRIWESTPRA
ncbi:MAG TPA: hypothetical protein VIL55_07405 [Naasia sp.]|jgi:hypothetical protein